MKLRFANSQPLTLGAELELQLIESETADLSSSSIEVLKAFGPSKKIQAEIFQSMIEITTGIHNDTHGISEDLEATVSRLLRVCDGMGLSLAAAGTHPFAKSSESQLFPSARFDEVLENYQWIARRLLIFGLHIHIGMRSREHAIQMTNALLGHLPLMLALSSSSPFLKGEDTRLASCRSTFFESLPTGGHPYRFDSWSEFEQAYQRLIQSKSIRSHKDLWWDIRPAPHYGTIEIRICDTPATLKETVALIALIHSLCSALDADIMAGVAPTSSPDWMLRENKWRAARFGTRAELIVSEDGATQPVSKITNQVIQARWAEIEKFGYQDAMATLLRIATEGSSADRQRARLKPGKDPWRRIVSAQIEEFKNNQPQWMEPLKRVRSSRVG